MCPHPEIPVRPGNSPDLNDTLVPVQVPERGGLSHCKPQQLIVIYIAESAETGRSKKD
jgi:hypothetical protein